MSNLQFSTLAEGLCYSETQALKSSSSGICLKPLLACF